MCMTKTVNCYPNSGDLSKTPLKPEKKIFKTVSHSEKKRKKKKKSIVWLTFETTIRPETEYMFWILSWYIGLQMFINIIGTPV